MTDDIEDIREKKLEELKKKKQQGQQDKEQQAKQQVQQIQNEVKQHLTKEALQRFGNIKAANPEKAQKISMFLYQLIKSGRLRDKIDDDTLKKMLSKLNKGKDINIKRK